MSGFEHFIYRIRWVSYFVNDEVDEKSRPKRFSLVISYDILTN